MFEPSVGRSNAQKWAFRCRGLGYERIVGREADVRTPGNWASERRGHCFVTLFHREADVRTPGNWAFERWALGFDF